MTEKYTSLFSTIMLENDRVKLTPFLVGSSR